MHTLGIAAVALLMAGPAVLAAEEKAQSKAHVIVIENMRFDPQSLVVSAGDRITWINKDLFPHTATAAKSFDSKDIGPNASWTLVAARPGDYNYICTFHPTMKATLTVR